MADPFDAGDEPAVAAADSSLIVAYKPPRMHSAPGRGEGCLCEWIFSRFPEAALAGGEGGGVSGEGGLLHRLDFETSGLVLFARTASAYSSLKREQAEGRFLKEYLARASIAAEAGPEGSQPPRSAPSGLGAADWEEGLRQADTRILTGLVRTAPAALIESAFRPYGPGAARVACIGHDAEGRRAPASSRALTRRCYATTLLRAEARGGEIELLVSISRGFRHQVRAQLAWVGLPILGDLLYGGAPARRLHLHACRLSFVHPATGRETTVEYP